MPTETPWRKGGMPHRTDGPKNMRSSKQIGFLIPRAIRTALLLLDVFRRLVRWEGPKVLLLEVSIDRLSWRARVFGPLHETAGGFVVVGLWERKKGYRKGTDKNRKLRNYGAFAAEALPNQWLKMVGPAGIEPATKRL